MSKIIINQDNEVTLSVEVGLGELIKQSENGFSMRINSGTGKEMMRESIIKLAKKKKLTKQDEEELSRYLAEYVKYSIMEFSGVESYPITEDENGDIINVDEDVEIIRE